MIHKQALYALGFQTDIEEEGVIAVYNASFFDRDSIQGSRNKYHDPRISDRNKSAQ